MNRAHLLPLSILLSLVLLLGASSRLVIADTNTYYVSPGGNDSNPGTIELPWGTVQYALNQLLPGDQLYLRGGVYLLTTSIVVINRHGSLSAPIRVSAYPEEHPIIDGSQLTDTRWAVWTMNNSDYWSFHGFSIQNAAGSPATINTRRGLQFTGTSSYNTIEAMDFSYNQGSGLHFQDSASNNLVLYSKSHHNYDFVNGGANADGFAVKGETANGNIFHGCEAWQNSDDGWDLRLGGPTIVEQSIARENGYDAGNGDGFKLGLGNGGHVILLSVATGNKYRGFNHNNAAGPLYLYNNTAYGNFVDYFFQQTTVSHVLKNNIGSSLLSKINPESLQEANSWNFAWGDTPGFESLDPQSPDYLSLNAGSPARDSGVQVPAAGLDAAPDLGALQFPV
jgi:hypothetical protein